LGGGDPTSSLDQAGSEHPIHLAGTKKLHRTVADSATYMRAWPAPSGGTCMHAAQKPKSKLKFVTLMMMIAFITFKSSLVPLFEGL